MESPRYFGNTETDLLATYKSYFDENAIDLMVILQLHLRTKSFFIHHLIVDNTIKNNTFIILYCGNSGIKIPFLLFYIKVVITKFILFSWFCKRLARKSANLNFVNNLTPTFSRHFLKKNVIKFIVEDSNFYV